MKDKKNIIIVLLVILVVALVWPGLISFTFGLAWTILKFALIALAIIIIISLILKKRK